MARTAHGAHNFVGERRPANGAESGRKASGDRWVRTIEQYPQQIGCVLKRAEGDLQAMAFWMKSVGLAPTRAAGSSTRRSPPQSITGEEGSSLGDL